jgi:hypothetical protein
MSTKDIARAVVCAGVLALAVTSSAVPVDPDSPNGIAAFDFQGGVINALCTNGEVWRFNGGPWERWADFDPPVPVTEIEDWLLTGFRNTLGEYWWFNEGAGTWQPVPMPPPCGAVQAQPQSLGSVKEMFK